MKKALPSREPSVHFIGIGGIGMSALAQWFLAQNWAVTGSDMSPSVVTHDLQKIGVRVKFGQKTAHLPLGTRMVIRTQAIPPQNPEFRAAIKQKVAVLTYPEMVGFLTNEYRTIAVSGAHGKSTTTALATLVLLAGGFDPTVLIGTRLRELPHANFRSGESSFLVLEADEYGRAFLNYTPLIALITNIDAEHLDTYGNLAGVKRAFLAYFERIATSGTLVVNRDDKILFSLRANIARIAKKHQLQVIWYSRHEAVAKRIAKTLSIPGQHNVSNALAVWHLGRLLRIPEQKVLKALHAYHGAWRRMEHRGTFRGAPLYDDYAHHPTEIRATLQAFREKYPKHRLTCVFQPHQAERLKRLFGEFKTAFDGADEVVLLPIYRVAGRDHDYPRANSAALAHVLQKKTPEKPVVYLGQPTDVAAALDALHAANPKPRVIVMMGAGTIADLTPDLLKHP